MRARFVPGKHSPENRSPPTLKSHPRRTRGDIPRAPPPPLSLPPSSPTITRPLPDGDSRARANAFRAALHRCPFSEDRLALPLSLPPSPPRRPFTGR